MTTVRQPPASSRRTVDVRDDLFGQRREVVKPAIDSLGVWPFTVWEVDEGGAADVHRRVRDAIGDTHSSKSNTVGGTSFPDCTRRRLASKSPRHADVDGTYGYQHGASIFSPVVGGLVLNMFAPRPATGHPPPLCLDPFGGGATRAALAARWGLRYRGVEIRREEVDFSNRRLAELGIGRGQAEVLLGDARTLDRHVGRAVGDFLYTCPPYFDLERYNGGPADLSMLPSYDAFCLAVGDVAKASSRALRPGALAVWVVGLHRDRHGGLLPLNHDVAMAHRAAGFTVLEEVIVYRRHSGAGARTKNFFTGQGHLARCHEYVLVFRLDREGRR